MTLCQYVTGTNCNTTQRISSIQTYCTMRPLSEAKTNSFQHTPWHSLEHFSQCVASRDVVADHSWRTKQRRSFIPLSICSVIKDWTAGFYIQSCENLCENNICLIDAFTYRWKDKGTAVQIKPEIQENQMCTGQVTDSWLSLTGCLLLSARLWNSLP